MTDKQRKYYSDYFKAKRRREHPLIDIACPHCKSMFLPVSHRQVFCSPRCTRKWYRKKQRVLRRKIGKCEVCGFSIPEALEAHHYTSKDLIVLCGSCHNIWHRLSKDKHSAKDIVISTVSNHLLNSQISHRKGILSDDTPKVEQTY